MIVNNTETPSIEQHYCIVESAIAYFTGKPCKAFKLCFNSNHMQNYIYIYNLISSLTFALNNTYLRLNKTI